MGRAAAATALLNRELNSLSGSAVRGVNRDLQSTSREIDKTGKSAETSGKQIDRLSGRLALLAQAAAVLGPALVPIGAAGIPAIAGLTAELGAAVGALGVAIIAFKGLGDSIKAVNAYQLEPTAANLEKVRAEFEKMGPAGAHFTLFLDSLGPQLQSIQNAARNGLFPGLEDGINELLTALPQVRRFVREIGLAMGQLASEVGADLTGPRFRSFFEYLDSDATPLLMSLGRTIGSLAAGFANLLAAFAPLSRAFSLGFEDMAAAFANWSMNLDSNDKFQGFLDYLQESGPKALDFLGSFTEALAAIVAAAAPVGSAVLPVLTAVADIFAAIAESPIGPVFFTAAAALSVYSRAMALAGSAQARFGASLSSTVGGLTQVTTAQQRAMLSATQLAASQRAQRSAMLAAGAQFAALGLVVSGTADKMGLANTATLGLMGSFAGPWGAAIGAATGFVMDFTSNTTKAGKQLKTWDNLVRQNISTVDAYASTLADAEDQLASLAGSMPSGLGDQLLKSLTPTGIKTNLQALFGDLDNTALGQQIEQTVKLRENYDSLVVAINGLGTSMGMAGFGAGQYTEDLDSLNSVLTRSKPAMDALGISVGDLALSVQNGTFLQLVDQINAWNRAADSTRGRTEAVADAIGQLNSEALSTADSANALAQALDALLSPQLSLSEATDQWHSGLRNLKDELDKTSRSLTAQTDAGDKNRAAIRDQVTNLTALMGAQAEAGAGSGKLSKTMRDGRKAIMDAGVAAGFSRKEMRDYLDTLGLTPKLVKTVIEAQTGEAMSDLDKLAARLAQMDGKTATTYVRTVYQHIGKSTQFGGADGDPSTPYDVGGFTGFGPRKRVAGIVHAGEVVLPQDVVRRDKAHLMSRYGHLPNMGALPGFAAGGFTGADLNYRTIPSRPSSSAPVVVSAQSLAGLRIEGRIEVDGREGYLRGVIREEIAAEGRFQRVKAGG